MPSLSISLLLFLLETLGQRQSYDGGDAGKPLAPTTLPSSLVALMVVRTESVTSARSQTKVVKPLSPSASASGTSTWTNSNIFPPLYPIQTFSIYEHLICQGRSKAYNKRFGAFTRSLLAPPPFHHQRSFNARTETRQYIPMSPSANVSANSSTPSLIALLGTGMTRLI